MKRTFTLKSLCMDFSPRHLKLNRKMRSILLLLCLLLLGTVSGIAQTPIGNFKYTLTTGTPNTATIVGYISDGLGTLTIPSTVSDKTNTYDVTAIGESAFKNNTTYSALSFETPSYVTTIGTSAFSGCTGLTSVTLPSSVTSIGTSAFLGCNKISTLSFGTPCQITTIPESAFSGCTALTSVTIPASVKSLGAYAFSGTGLTSIDLPATLNASQNILGNYVFQNCKSLKTVTIEASLRALAQGAFLGCSVLETINIPSTVTNIQAYVFKDCSKLTTIIIPAAVTQIQDYSFQNCTSLASVYVSSTSVPTLGTSVFASTPSTKTLYILDGGSNTLYNTHSATTAAWYTNGFRNFKHYWKPEITAVKYATLFLNYAAKIPTGVTAYWATKNGDNIQLNKLTGTVIPSSQGVLLAGNAATYQFDETTDAVTDNLTGNAFSGYVTAQAPNASNSYFTLQNGTSGIGFYKYTGTSLLANKAFISSSASSKEFIGFSNTTGISKTTTNAAEGDNIYYNLQGQKVNNPGKGIFILNGRKTYINK